MTDSLNQKAKTLLSFISAHRSDLKLIHTKLSTENRDIATEAVAIGLTYEDDVDKLIFKTKDFLDGSNIYCFELLPKRITKEVFDNSFFIYSSLIDNFAYFEKNQEKFTFFDPANTSFVERVNACYYYFRVLFALCEDEFCDHHNEANKQLVFYSNSNGILKLGYDLEPDVNINYHESEITKFEEYSKSSIYKTFLINTFYEVKSGHDTLHIHELLDRLGFIIKIGYKNQELASKQFDFENFKKKLYKEKEKYFSTIRDVVNKIFAQIIGVPVSISASVLASYKVQADGDCVLLIFIMAAFIIYTVYFVIIQITYYSDLAEIESDFNRDFTIISTESGISASDIDYESQKINKKIRTANNLLIFLIVIVLLLSILVMFHLLNQFINCNVNSLLGYIILTLKNHL
jgi:hypothetical protein